jgi:1-phosphofructokinase
VGSSAQVMVFAPAPQLTVTIERLGARTELHLHAGGQGL